MKFYPRDWRGDQALRKVSLTARGLWIDMITIMYEATPYGHLIIGARPVSGADLARLVGSSEEEVQALLVELLDARVARKTRGGVIYSKRMLDDDKRSIEGRKAKLEALEKAKKKASPSRVGASPPTTQRPESRGKVEGPNRPSTLSEAKNDFLGPKEVRDAFLAKFGPDWVGSYLDPCGWQDVPERALIPATRYAGTKIIRDARSVLAALGLSVLERAA
jgi:hypothetical protein